MPEHIASRLGPALSSMSRLQSVLLWIETGLPIEVVQALSQVQTLESVLLGVIHDEAQPPSSNQSLTYFSAKNLRYVAQRKALSWLLPLTMSSNVEALSILFSPSDANFDGLGSPVDYPNLTTLKVSFILQWSELTPLLAFRGLKELSITPAFDWEEHWSTSETRLLVESFPLLEVLVLGDGPNSFDVLLTLPDLDCFARHCPRLWYLGASIDARAIHTFTGTVTPHPAIREVDLQESEAAEHEAEFEVAGLIKRLWPNLQKGSRMYHDTLPGEEPWGQESIKAFWDNVWSLMDFAEPDGRFDYTCTKMYEISLVDF
ncbi:hypothetical protein FRB90_009400 [Tulasnella sp. 427]|nr:hypothetical protein FRB90_009400 [Tulasnella sp. 427]